MATRTARAALETSLSVLFAGALVLGLSSSAALAAGNRAASSGAADRPVVLLPDDDGPYELVMDEDDEEWDEDLETDETTGEDADDGESVIGDAVQGGGRQAQRRGRAGSVASHVPAGPRRAKSIPPKAGPVSSPGPDQDVTLLAGPASAMAAAGTSASTLGAPAAGVLGTSLERPASPVLPPAELFAAPARHITGGAEEVPSLPEGQGPAAMTLAGALLAVGVLGAGTAAMHRPRA